MPDDVGHYSRSGQPWSCGLQQHQRAVRANSVTTAAVWVEPVSGSAQHTDLRVAIAMSPVADQLLKRHQVPTIPSATSRATHAPTATDRQAGHRPRLPNRTQPSPSIRPRRTRRARPRRLRLGARISARATPSTGADPSVIAPPVSRRPGPSTGSWGCRRG